jgi:hypothetical protein
MSSFMNKASVFIYLFIESCHVCFAFYLMHFGILTTTRQAEVPSNLEKILDTLWIRLIGLGCVWFHGYPWMEYGYP